MTDYAAEQAEEIEALSAILMDEFSPLEGPLPAGWAEKLQSDHPSTIKAYRILVTPTSGLDAGEAAASHAKQLDLVFAHTPTYPDEPPLIKPRSVRGLSDAELAEMAAVVDEQVEANAGMAMMFAVVSAAQEWLRSRVSLEEGGGGAAGASTSGGGGDNNNYELTEEEAKLAEERAREEEEARAAAARALGTPVTPETFDAWRRRFDAEREAAGIIFGSVYRGEGEGAEAEMSADVEAAAAAAAKRKAGKLTGRVFFQKMDATAAAGGVGGVGGDGEEEAGEGEGTSYDEEEAEADREAREALLREEAGDLFDESSDDDDEGDDDDDDDLLEELETKLKKVSTAG